MFSVSLDGTEDTAYGGNEVIAGHGVPSKVLVNGKGRMPADWRSADMDDINAVMLPKCRSALAINGTTFVSAERRRRNSKSIGLSSALGYQRDWILSR